MTYEGDVAKGYPPMPPPQQPITPPVHTVHTVPAVPAVPVAPTVPASYGRRYARRLGWTQFACLAWGILSGLGPMVRDLANGATEMVALIDLVGPALMTLLFGFVINLVVAAFPGRDLPR